MIKKHLPGLQRASDGPLQGRGADGDGRGERGLRLGGARGVDAVQGGLLRRTPDHSQLLVRLPQRPQPGGQEEVPPLPDRLRQDSRRRDEGSGTQDSGM